MELEVSTFNENLICQPVSYTNSMIALINKENISYLSNYNGNGEKLWQENVDGYALGSLSVQDSKDIDLLKDTEDNLLLTMYRPEISPTNVIIAQNVKLVKFNQNGNFIWQITDTIHQPDTIFIEQDTIVREPLGKFKAANIVCLSGGNYAIVSSLKSNKVDSTYIQVSVYNSNAGFVTDTHYKILGLRNMVKIYTTSNDRLVLITNREGAATSNFLLMDLSGNIIYDNPAQVKIEDSYFFCQNNRGQLIISFSFLNSGGNLRGALVALGASGVVWTNLHDETPAWIMTSINEVSDGYLFSGFSAEILSPGFNWQTTFLTGEHRAVILKTDFSGNEVWNKILDTNFYSAGAVSLGNSPISFFGGRYEASGEKLFLIKYTSGGDISQ
jgi:hypothetical protein